MSEVSPMVVFIPGTHSRSGPGIPEWWHLGQPMAQAFQARGYMVTAFPWTTELDGIFGPSRRWRDAGEKLGLWLRLNPVDLVLAHSHGGNLLPVAMLSAPTVSVPALVTLGTPVRPELDLLYARMRQTGQVPRWLHIYAEGDWWQWWGSRPRVRDWWRPTAWTTTRTMPHATENRSAGSVGHHGLLDLSMLERIGFWSWQGRAGVRIGGWMPWG